MQCVLAAKPTIFFELQTLSRFFLILVGHIIAIFAIRTLQYNIVSHNSVFCYL
jgi:hypothetical protein